MRFLPLYQFQP
jgi:hypothetical protein